MVFKLEIYLVIELDNLGWKKKLENKECKKLRNNLKFLQKLLTDLGFKTIFTC